MKYRLTVYYKNTEYIESYECQYFRKIYKLYCAFIRMMGKKDGLWVVDYPGLEEILN